MGCTGVSLFTRPMRFAEKRSNRGGRIWRGEHDVVTIAEVQGP